MNNDLVSIVLLTHNQSQLVLETLDSIHLQTYPNIELIISDDCSKDNTIEICEEWLSTHKDRFKNTQIVRSSKNTGISGNINRGLDQAKGRWIQKVDGDDILYPDATENYVKYMLSHPEASYVFAKMEPFGEDFKVCDEFKQNILKYDFFKYSAKEQYRRLMMNQVYIPAPTCFFDRAFSVKKKIRCDESIPMVDDWPRWVRLTKGGTKLYFMDVNTVHYRVIGSSMSHGRVNSPFQRSQMLFYIKYQFKYNLLRHPRSSWIKFVKYKQYTTDRRKWHYLERIGKMFDVLYCRIKGVTIDDWQKIDDAIHYR